MDLGIAGRVALVTGGSRGLGRQSALSLAREGATVAICARGEETLRRTVGELRAAGAQAEGFVADVTKLEDCERLHREVVRAFGKLDILVNNVGASRRTTVLTTSEEDWRLVIDADLMAAVRLSRLAIPGMQERGWGRIINVASIWGREYGGGMPYMTMKAALIAMTKHTALEHAKDGILINSVAPGSVEFPGGGWEHFQQTNPPSVVQDFVEHNLPMGRFGWPEPVGDLVAFLASERIGFLTGACINIDGGQSKSLI
jgi:3-oxoacyl-[acyl-carrier protein] reductase